MRLGFALLALLATTACGGGQAVEADEPPDDPIEQMVLAFQGSPTETEIREALENAMNATDLPLTDENYSRAGSVVVSFRKEYGIKEMEILECMPKRANDPRVPDNKFVSVSAVCITDLVQGDYP